MNNGRATEKPAGMTLGLGDVYFVLFRHKWKILLLSLAGIGAAVAIYFFDSPPYQSQAELLIEYVPQASTLSLPGSDQKVIVPDARGGAVINAEIQILTSLDVAAEAATNVGPASILANFGGGSNAIAAASVIRANLQAGPAGRGSSVIVVSFKDPDPRIVQPVLQEVINAYRQKHKEIHSKGGEYDDALSREGTALSVQLHDTEQQLSNLKNKASIVSLTDESQGLANQISKIQGNIFSAQAELAGYEAAMKLAGSASSEKPETSNAPPPVPQDQIEAYNTILWNLGALRKKEQAYLLSGYTKSNVLVIELDEQFDRAQKALADMEKKYPQIAQLRTATAVGEQSGTGVADMRNLVAQVAAVQAKLKLWNDQLDHLQMQATNLNNMAPTINQLETMEAIQKQNYTTLVTKMEASHIQDAIDAGKTPNIKPVQSPSPPFRDWKKTHKMMAVAAFGGILGGIGLAFLIELFLDPTVKRPVEIESKLNLPLFLSIPDVRRNGRARLARPAERRLLRMHNNEEASVPTRTTDATPDKNGEMQVVSLEKNPALQPFYEALRDRLVVYFEVRNLTHKPKLVAVTGANPGAGVSTVAAGLAASLSETGDGNVLLVDMNLEHGAAQQFYKGKPGCELDTALVAETKENALVQENLYVVNGNIRSAELPRILPKRFAALVPKLKASDFDYIIFDLPPVTQTSITPRLSGFMDTVLMIVESEKSDREVVRRASALLAESGATVSAVLNKTRKYVPERLHREFLSDK